MIGDMPLFLKQVLAYCTTLTRRVNSVFMSTFLLFAVLLFAENRTIKGGRKVALLICHHMDDYVHSILVFSCFPEEIPNCH